MEPHTTGIDFSLKLMLAYNQACRPLCQEIGLPQTAFDILMFLANNPEYHTARDIVEIRKIKANLVSINVEKLVREGYLTRTTVQGDRRKTQLTCTEKAQPLIQRGRQVQNAFLKNLFEGTDETSQKLFLDVMRSIEKRLDSLLEGDT